MSPLAKGFALMAGMALAGTAASFAYFHFTGESRMKYVCDQVAIGMTLPQLKEFALDNRLSLPSSGDGVATLGAERSYGPHVCRVTLQGGVVTLVGQGVAQ